MNCEVEFLPVGKASKGGDAIIVRTGEPTSFRVTIIDGGDLEAGKNVVKHIKAQYGANCIVADVIRTHADADHASGLREVLSELDVRNLWLHLPWKAAVSSRQYFANKNWTDQGLTTYLEKEYDLAWELVRLAQERNIPVREPFAGAQIGPFTVFSPSKEAYSLFLPQFGRTPDPDQAAIEAKGYWIGKEPNLISKLIERATAKVQSWIKETWEKELLRDGGQTSASNESSVVLYGDFGPKRKVLLTGDAGPWGLTMAVNYAYSNLLPLQDFMFVQIPHHGSRRNIGPTILNHILGPILPKSTPSHFSAYVSAPQDDTSHPRKMVLNAYIRRGGSVVATQGVSKVFWGGFPVRSGYTVVYGMSFAADVEDYD